MDKRRLCRFRSPLAIVVVYICLPLIILTQSCGTRIDHLPCTNRGLCSSVTSNQSQSKKVIEAVTSYQPVASMGQIALVNAQSGLLIRRQTWWVWGTLALL